MDLVVAQEMVMEGAAAVVDIAVVEVQQVERAVEVEVHIMHQTLLMLRV